MKLRELNETLMNLAAILTEEGAPEADKAIKDLFMNNDVVKDDMVHSLADKLGIEHSQFEGMIYAFLSDALKGKLLKNWDAPDSDFDPEQLKRGIEVEMEHTDNPAWAKAIAKTHLRELPDYYVRLDKMEKD